MDHVVLLNIRRSLVSTTTLRKHGRLTLTVQSVQQVLRETFPLQSPESNERKELNVLSI